MPHRTPSRRPARRILRRLGLAAALAATAAGMAGVSAPAWASDSFYTALLRDGILAYDRGAFGDAARDLRLACFGLLDEPETLAACLVRLAVAQGAAGDAEGFQATFRRVVEIEERFGAYAKADLPPAVRAAFEERVGKAIPAATLAAVPAIQRLARKPEAPPGGQKTREPRPAARPPVPSPPTSVTEPARPTAEVPTRPAGAGGAGGAGERRAAGTVPVAGGAGPAGEPGSAGTGTPPPAAVVSAVPPAAVPRPLTAAERQSLDEARRLLAQTDGKALRQALQLAGEVADAHPEDRAAQHLAAEAAYRNARWEEAAAFFRRGGDPGDQKPELLFYMAVTLFEKGDPQAAAAALRRALPNLERTPYVDSYARRILGS
jgi:hypothetical protein